MLMTVAGIAIAVGLLGSLGGFIASAKTQMTRRAVAQVPVDWQIEAQPGAELTPIIDAVRARRDVRVALPVELATTTGFQATSNGTTQSTGPGVVVGLPRTYRREFPAEIRTLTGASVGSPGTELEFAL